MLFFLCSCKTSENTRNISVFCAASFRQPMEDIAQNFEAKHGIEIVRNYGGSGALLAQASLSSCDFYLPADESYLSTQLARDVVQQQTKLFLMSAVFICRESDRRWDGKRGPELLEEVQRLSLGDQSTAIGVYAEALMRERKLWTTDLERKLIRKPSVSSAINDVALEAADITFAWRPLVHQRDDLKLLNMAGIEGEPVAVSLAKMKNSDPKDEVQLFWHFMKKHGTEVFARYGFEAD